ncbi:hypothetical protein HHL19_21430 [Streptomyces sp. R302]|uniref:hypothetical protein n=1 Tax=unclassified Streptomyces TaxID=2593676 RepID=UPI00145CE2BB|nr:MULTISPECIES: hypothetical protein [unclassified Streptomyces]NML51060.1 hypothetical protein [Streptomyces sp. R301]NML81155.1 hypothetical protein [Streptomyces sp. R302]
MTGRTDGLDAWAHLWRAPEDPPRWVVWAMPGETLVFDVELNVPAPVDDALLPEVLRRMRAAGAPESDAYPGRACA